MPKRFFASFRMSKEVYDNTPVIASRECGVAISLTTIAKI